MIVSFCQLSFEWGCAHLSLAIIDHCTVSAITIIANHAHFKGVVEYKEEEEALLHFAPYFSL